MPGKSAKLLIGASGTEHKGSFAGIEAVARGVDDVVHTINEQAEWKDDVDETDPEDRSPKGENCAEWHEVKEDGRSPKTRAGNLEEKSEVGKEIRFDERLGRRLGGYAHLLWNVAPRWRRRQRCFEFLTEMKLLKRTKSEES